MNNHLCRAPQKELEREKERKKTHTNTRVHHNTIPPHTQQPLWLRNYTTYQQPHWLRKYKIACNSLNVLEIYLYMYIHKMALTQVQKLLSSQNGMTINAEMSRLNNQISDVEERKVKTTTEVRLP